MFVNLAKNAVEALSERYGDVQPFPGRVEVRIGRTDRFVWATVADKRRGIPKDRQSAIFDPFYTTKPPGRGTGLGLNIVYRILTKYQGQITVESIEGEGTTFQVRFPIDDGSDRDEFADGSDGEGADEDGSARGSDDRTDAPGSGGAEGQESSPPGAGR